MDVKPGQTTEVVLALIADAAGRFQTPKELDPNGEYAARASTAGFQSNPGVWTMGEAGSFPGMTLPAEPGANVERKPTPWKHGQIASSDLSPRSSKLLRRFTRWLAERDEVRERLGEMEEQLRLRQASPLEKT